MSRSRALTAVAGLGVCMIALVGCSPRADGVISLAWGNNGMLEAIVVACGNTATSLSIRGADEQTFTEDISPPTSLATIIEIDIDSLPSGTFSVWGDTRFSEIYSGSIGGDGYLNGPSDVTLKLVQALSEDKVIAPTGRLSQGAWEVIRREDFTSSVCKQ